MDTKEQVVNEDEMSPTDSKQSQSTPQVKSKKCKSTPKRNPSKTPKRKQASNSVKLVPEVKYLKTDPELETEATEQSTSEDEVDDKQSLKGSRRKISKCKSNPNQMPKKQTSKSAKLTPAPEIKKGEPQSETDANEQSVSEEEMPASQGTPKSANKTPKKKQATKSKQTPVRKIKDDAESDLQSPSTSKEGRTTMVSENEGDEWDVDDVAQEDSTTVRNDLPDYVAKFGIEQVKIDRFKLDVPHTNLQYVAIDEICLEGLDGLTIEALWTRISVTIKQPLPLPDTITNFIWNTITKRKDIEFYKLQKPRPNLVIFDRYQNSDPDIGAAMDPVKAPLDIYPYHPVKAKDVVGSAASYDTRENITSEVRRLTLAEAEAKYGLQLVMVGTQKLRMKVLMNPLADPNIEFTPAQYCLLERIGRSRRLGETTQGKVSLQIISRDPKIIFYTRKILAENRLISKQPFYMKGVTANHLSGSLLHLTRFYNEKKTKTQIMTEQIVEVLRNRPMYRMEYSEAKKVFGNLAALNKLFKLPDFQRFVKTDVQLKYRDLYPNASVKEWKLKGNGKERMIRTLELINPNVNIGGSWNEEDPKEESSDDEETKEIIYNAPILHQVYNYIRSSGSEGRTLKEIQANKGMDFYSVRAAVNQLVNQNLVVAVKIDIGRQRIMKYHTCHHYSNEDEGAYATEERITEANELEKESLEFLSDLLEIEPKFLAAPCADTGELNAQISSPTSGNYALVKRLRQQNKQTKSENKEKSVLAKNRGSENIQSQVFIGREGLKIESIAVGEDTDATEQAQKSFNSSVLEKIFKNQHEYNAAQNMLTCANEITNFDADSRTYFKEMCREISNASNCVQIISCKRKKKKIHKRLLLKIKQASSEFQDPLPIEELLKNMVCPLVFPTKDASLKPRYHKLCAKVLRIVEPILSHFQYRVKALVPKKRYMCRHKLPNDKMIQFSKDHPLLNLAVLDLTTAAKHKVPSALFANLGLKRKAESAGNDDNKRIRLEEDPSTSLNEALPLVSSFNIYMGPNPTLAYHSVDEDNIEITVLVSTKPEEFDETGSKYIKDNNATMRTLKRAHCILEAVRQEKVITDIRRLHRMIQTQDNEEGYNVKVDKKSVERIYTRLVRSGHIKVLQIILKSTEIRRSVTVICDPALDVQHSLIESLIEQLKMRFFITARKKDWDVPQPKSLADGEMETFDTSEISSSVGELKLLSSNDSPYLYNRNIGKDYGHAPKFMRMRVLHEFLFHLIYNYPYGQEVDDVAGMLKELDVAVDDDVLKEMPRVYCKEISWKMFIPPLPRHAGWSEGWALVCDVLLRLPLSLFVKLYNVSYVIPELPMYLEHPVKQYYLVKHLPLDIRNGILHRRKYIFSIHETLARLCYIGILQFGPQKLREKDQLFIYLNRNATLLDTTTSNAGYHYVEDKEYKKVQYHFTSPADVESYWYEMWNICAHSKLGLRNTVTGTYITIEQVDTKPAMQEAMKPQTPESAFRNDNGYVPGDKRGAAGLDSALWSHIKRNWIWCNRVIKIQPESSHTEATSSKKRKENVDKKSRKKKHAKPISNRVAEASSADHLLPVTESRRRIYRKTTFPTKRSETSEPIRKGKSYIRKVLPRVDMKKKKDYDSIDKKLMENLKQSRSEWNEAEDRVLHICKIVATFLCPNIRKQIIPYTVIRDVLHKLSASSTNKTSGACQRRLGVIFGTSEQQEYLQHIVRTLHHIPFVRKYFQKLYDLVDSGNALSDQQLNGAFVYLVAYFFKHQHEIQHIFEAIVYKYQLEHKSLKSKVTDKGESFLPNTFSKKADASANNPQAKTNPQSSYEPGPVEVVAYDCTEVASTKTKTNLLYPQSSMFPQTEKDVILDTIKGIIHSTIGSRQEEISWIYQLFRVYQNYPDDLLEAALTEIRNSQMISIKRTYTKKHNDAEGLPITTKFFQFSFYYGFTQITKFPPELFQEAHEIFLGIVKHKESLVNTPGPGLPMECFEQGHAVGLAEVAVDMNTYFFVDIPKEVLILNPKIADHTELIRELAVRYKKMLTSVKEGTYFKDDDNDESGEHSNLGDDDFPKQTKSLPRTPMIQRFLKSWFLADELEVAEDVDEPPANSDKPPSGPSQQPSMEEVPETEIPPETQDAEKRSTSKPEKKKKRTTQMTSEESKKILESLNPQLYLGRQDAQASSSKASDKADQSSENTSNKTMPDKPELNLYPIAGTMPDLTFEDYEKKLESLLSSKDGENYDLPLEVTLKENQNVDDGPDSKEKPFVLTDFADDTNILEKYLLHSKKHLTTKTPAGEVDIDAKQSGQSNISEKRSTIEESNDSDPITNARIQYLMNDELTVEQIMEEMLIECPPEDRKVPKPINLARLLVKGLFPELDEDEERLERLHQHFLIVCPDTSLTLSDFEDDEDFKYVYLEHTQTCKQLLRKVQMDIITSDTLPTNNGFTNKLRTLDASDLDIFVTESLVDFVLKKRVVGASVKQLKENFSNLENIKLSTLLQTLTDMNILVRTGITYIVYVHHKYRMHWLVESCTLEDRDRLKLRETKTEESSDVDLPALAKSLESYNEIKVKIMPWARIDGTLNLKVFEKWMCTILGYCLSDMMVPLISVIRSCSFLKPVDIYYLVECLQELGCVQMIVYRLEKPTLFSAPSYVEAVPAEITDAFEDIYIEADRLAVIKFGTLLNKKSKEFDFLSDEAKKYGTF